MSAKLMNTATVLTDSVSNFERFYILQIKTSQKYHIDQRMYLS